MNEQNVIDIGSKAILVSMQVAAPALLATLAMGIIVSIVQAATQINEQTLAFIPKIIAMTIALVLFGPWILQVMMGFTVELFRQIPTISH